MATFNTPQSGEFNPYYQTYINYITEDVLEVLQQQSQDMAHLMESLSENELDYRYSEGKWSIREVILHILDTERIFAYRCLSVSRGEDRDHMGFDQNDYIDKNDFSHLTSYHLLKAFNAVRASTIALLENMSSEQAMRIGMVSGGPFSANAGAYVIAGHMVHHLNILRERYLNANP